jgi:peptide chain release factor 2
MSKELLVSVTKKDLEITWFSNKKAGGQHLNKHPSGCRIKHKDTGIIVTATEQRSRDQNLKVAFNRLANHKDFKTWLKIESSKALVGKKELEKQLNDIVDESMKEDNLKVEYFTPKGN